MCLIACRIAWMRWVQTISPLLLAALSVGAPGGVFGDESSIVPGCLVMDGICFAD